jgi:hypothetical protein
MAVALLALTISLGGTGYAATKLAANSVGTAQLKASAVTGAKVKNFSLSATDFKTGQLPRGATGLTGPAGPAGASGNNGRDGTNGATGANGSALAYARIKPDGTVDPDASQGIAVLPDAIVGLACLNYTGGSVHNFSLTIDNSGADPASAKIAGTAVPASLGSCPAGTDVLVGMGNPLPANLPFYVTIIG